MSDEADEQDEKKATKFSVKKIPRKMRIRLLEAVAVIFGALVLLYAFSGGPSQKDLPQDMQGSQIDSSAADTKKYDSHAGENPNYERLRYEDQQRKLKESRENHTSYLAPFDADQRKDRFKTPITGEQKKQPVTTTRADQNKKGAQSFDKATMATIKNKLAVMKAVFKAESDTPASISIEGNAMLASNNPQAARGAALDQASGSDRSPSGNPAVAPETDRSSADSSTPSTSSNRSRDKAAIHPLRPGDVLFTRLVTHVNTDEPSPVMARVISGPLVGAELIGTAKRVGGAAIIQYKTLSWKRYTTNIDAVAIALDTARTAVASDVDRHILARWGSLLLAGGLSGARDMIKSGGTSAQVGSGGVVITNQAKADTREIVVGALGGVGDELRTVLKDNFNRPPTVYVNPDDKMFGVLFLSSVDASWLPEAITSHDSRIGQSLNPR